MVRANGKISFLFLKTLKFAKVVITHIYVLKNYLNISNKNLPCTSFHNDASTRGVTKMTACISTVYLLLRLLGQQGMVMQLKAKCHPQSSLVNNKISENSKNVDIL